MFSPSIVKATILLKHCGEQKLDCTKHRVWSMEQIRPSRVFAPRVSTIMELIPPERWKHLNGLDNPADCASRGLYPSELLCHGMDPCGSNNHLPIGLNLQPYHQMTYPR